MASSTLRMKVRIRERRALLMSARRAACSARFLDDGELAMYLVRSHIRKSSGVPNGPLAASQPPPPRIPRQRRSIPSSAAAGSAASISAHRPPQQRMPPVRRDLRQRHQHEAALLQPRMRQDQPRRRLHPAARPRAPSSRAPSPRRAAPRCRWRARSRSQTRGPQRAPGRRPSAASTRMQPASTAPGAQVRRQRRGAVDIVRPRPGRIGRRAEPARSAPPPAAPRPPAPPAPPPAFRAAAPPPKAGSRRARSGACHVRASTPAQLGFRCPPRRTYKRRRPVEICLLRSNL